MTSKFYIVVVLALLISGSSYAVITSNRQVEIPCRLATTGIPSKLIFAADPKIQYGVTLNGIWAEGYTDGLIAAGAGKIDPNMVQMLSENNRKIQLRIIINVSVTCLSSKKEVDLEVAGDSAICGKGEGLVIRMYDPECDGSSVNKRGIFTLTETREVDEQKVVSAEQPPPIFVNVTNPDVPDSIIVGEAAVQPFAAAAVPTYIRTAPITPPQPLPPSATIVAPHYDRTAPIDHLQPLILGEVPPGTVWGGDAPQPSLADFGFEYANAAGDTPIQPPMVAAPAYDRTAPVVPPSYVGNAPQTPRPIQQEANIPQCINMTGTAALQPNPAEATAWHVYRHMAEPAAPQQPDLAPTDLIRGATITLQRGASVVNRQVQIGSYHSKH